MTAVKVGLDVGGTKILGVALQNGEVVNSIRVPTPQDQDHLLGCLRVMADELGAPALIGVGVPGPVSIEQIIQNAPNLRCLAGLAASDISKAIGREVRVGNDARCATLAEWQLGRGERINNFVLVSLGTGIGTGYVLNGKLVLGCSGSAGEIGHMIVDPNGPECPCGQQGCWEQVASGKTLNILAQRGFREGWLSSSDGSQLLEHDVSGKDLIAAARIGNEKALSMVDELARGIALGIVNILNIFDPERIVIVGGLTAATDVLLPKVEDWRNRLWSGFYERRAAPIFMGTLGDRAGAIGAALLPEFICDSISNPRD